MSEDKAKRVNGSMLYEGPSGMLVPDANKALEMVGGGGGLYMAGAKLEREHVLDHADEAYKEVMQSGMKPGTTFRTYLEEKCGCLSTVDSSNAGKQIGKEAKNYIMWSLTGKSGDEPRISKAASAAALGFLEWAAAHKFVPMVTERRYFDERIGYSIEVDAVGMLDGVLTALTVAVGPKLYDKHILRSAAAVNATNLEIGGVKQGIVLRLPKTDEDFSESPFEARIINTDNSKRDLGGFVNALGTWVWSSGYERTYAEKKAAKPKKAAAGMSQWKVEITGTAWLKSEITLEASDKAEAEKLANEKFDELEWEIVEMDRPVIMEVTASEVTNICESKEPS